MVTSDEYNSDSRTLYVIPLYSLTVFGWIHPMLFLWKGLIRILVIRSTDCSIRYLQFPAFSFVHRDFCKSQLLLMEKFDRHGMGCGSSVVFCWAHVRQDNAAASRPRPKVGKYVLLRWDVSRLIELFRAEAKAATSLILNIKSQSQYDGFNDLILVTYDYYKKEMQEWNYC